MEGMNAGELFSVVTQWLLTNILAIILAIVIISVGWGVAQLVSMRARKRMRLGGGDETLAPVIAQTMRYIIFIFTLMLALAALGVPVTAMLTVLGAAAVGVAIALRSILANVAAGMMILTLRPMSIGDYIVGSGVSGTVTEIGLFNTLLKTSDGIYVFVPNSQIWGKAITNYSREKQRRFDLKVGIAYDADITKARKALMKIATSDSRVLDDPAPAVYVSDFGSYSIIMLLRLWVKTDDYLDVRYSFVEQVKRAFDKDNIEIPDNRLNVEMFLDKQNVAFEKL